MKIFLLLVVLTGTLFAGNLTYKPLEEDDASQTYRFYSNNSPVAIVKVDATGIVTCLQGHVPDGSSTYVNENGIKVAVWPFKSGKASGIYQEFSPDGEVIKLINYQFGRRNGAYKEFWDDGSNHIVATYVKGRLNGHYKEFDEDGKLVREDEYENGKLIKNLYFLDNMYKNYHQ
jgi:antitoxin component YwqK of YwqJK toxin-antitoxin module